LIWANAFRLSISTQRCRSRIATFLTEETAMKSMMLFGLACLAVGSVGVLPAKADGDAAAGKKVFAKCTACHDATTGKDKVGPTLVGVIGRTAGTLESYLSKYSANMKEAGAGGLVWDDANLTAYLHNPKAIIPKGKMAFPGLKQDADIANVIAYLKADPKP
jgi:cytochrome c